MNQKIIAIYLFLFFITPRSFSQASSTIDSLKSYKNLELGWKITIPNNYSVNNSTDRAKVTDAAIKKLGAKKDVSNTKFLISFKKNNASAYPSFLSGLQNKNTIGIPINTEADFIKFATVIAKRAAPKLSVEIFKKKIGKSEFYGYQFFNPETNIYQKGLTKIIGKWIFYQTWIFDNPDDQSVLEDAVYNATFN